MVNTGYEEGQILLARVYEEVRRDGQATPETLKKLAAHHKESIGKVSIASSHAKASLIALGAGGEAFTKSIYKGEQGMGAFNGALDGMASAATEAGTALMLLGGPFGILAGILVHVIAAGAKAAKVVAKQGDDQYAAYQQLAKVGFAGRGGMEATTAAAKKLSYDVSKLGEFASLMADNSKELAMFSGGVEGGGNFLADTGEVLSKSRQEFLRMGMSVQSVNEGAAALIALQNRTGRTNSMNVEQMAEATRNYIYEQDIVTKLTGQSRQGTEEARKKALEDERYQALTIKMNREKAGSGDRLINLVDRFTAMSMPGMAKGVRDLASGLTDTDEAKALLNSGNQKLLEQLSDFKKGMKTPAEMAQLITEGVRDFSVAQGQTVGQYQAIGKTFVSMDEQSRAIAFSQHDQVKQEEIIRVEQEKNKAKQGDKATANQATLIDKQIEITLKTQDLIGKGIGPLATAMSKMMDVVDDLIDGIKNLVGWFLKEPAKLKATKEQVDASETKLASASKEYLEAVTKYEADKTEANELAMNQLLITKTSAEEELVKTKKDFEEGTAEDRRQKRRERREVREFSDTAGGAASGVAVKGGVAPPHAENAASAPKVATAAGAEAKGTDNNTSPNTKAAPKVATAAGADSEVSVKGGAAPAPKAAGATPGENTTGQAAPKGTVATQASRQATDMIANFESFTPKAHWDYAQYSIGYGTKTDAPDEISGLKQITPAEGKTRLQEHIQKLMPSILPIAKQKQWGQNQVDAMTSFAYNLGPASISSVTDGGKRSNADTASAIPKYNLVGGKVLPGLEKRRASEQSLFLKDMPQMAAGGITKGPSIVGEAGPEAVIPMQGNKVPVDLGNVTQNLKSLRKNTTNLNEKVETVNLDSAVKEAVNTIMSPNEVEQEILQILDGIRRSNQTTQAANKKILSVSLN